MGALPFYSDVLVKLVDFVVTSGGGHLCKFVDICLLTGISENDDPPTHEFPVSTGNFDTKW